MVSVVGYNIAARQQRKENIEEVSKSVNDVQQKTDRLLHEKETLEKEITKLQQELVSQKKGLFC